MKNKETTEFDYEASNPLESVKLYGSPMRKFSSSQFFGEFNCGLDIILMLLIDKTSSNATFNRDKIFIPEFKYFGCYTGSN